MYDRMMLELSKIMHFKVKPFYASSYEDGFRRMKKRMYDFYSYVSFLHDQSVLHIIITSEQMVFVVPFGNPLTQLEKFLSPFDSTTWFMILTTLTVSFIGIKVVSFTSRRLKDLCFGNQIGSPTMNFLNVFLCGGQARTPRTSNARFIFLNFMIWCLIIRTCFQSLMYRALQMDLRHPHMETIQDILDNQFGQWSMFLNPKTDDLKILYYK